MVAAGRAMLTSSLCGKMAGQFAPPESLWGQHSVPLALGSPPALRRPGPAAASIAKRQLLSSSQITTCDLCLAEGTHSWLTAAEADSEQTRSKHSVLGQIKGLHLQPTVSDCSLGIFLTNNNFCSGCLSCGICYQLGDLNPCWKKTIIYTFIRLACDSIYEIPATTSSLSHPSHHFLLPILVSSLWQSFPILVLDSRFLAYLKK